jgi:hypothetical protein
MTPTSQEIFGKDPLIPSDVDRSRFGWQKTVRELGSKVGSARIIYSSEIQQQALQLFCYLLIDIYISILANPSQSTHYHHVFQWGTVYIPAFWKLA